MISPVLKLIIPQSGNEYTLSFVCTKSHRILPTNLSLRVITSTIKAGSWPPGKVDLRRVVFLTVNGWELQKQIFNSQFEVGIFLQQAVGPAK